MDPHIRITLRRFNHGCVERRAPDRVDALLWIDIVGREVQSTGFIVDHSAAHWDGVSQHFVGNAELFECVNPPRRDGEIDRPPTDNIAFARISPPLVKIDIVPASPEVRAEQSASESATDENKLRGHHKILNRESAFALGYGATGNADITDFQIKELAQSPARTQSIVA
jgi:hypothetical protein